MRELLQRVATTVAVLAALAALIALVYAGSAWLHDLREHAGAGHGPGGGAVALAAAALAAVAAAILGLRRTGGSR